MGGFPTAALGLAFQAKDFAVLLSFLDSQGAVQVLSSPRVATLNNQKAVLKVGLDQPFISGVTAGAVTTNTVTGAQTSTLAPTLTQYFSGVSLDITPQIDEDGNILLHIHPLVSRVEQGQLQFNTGVSNQNLPIAKTTINETDTVVRVQDGNIVALGGLMSVELSSGKSGVPGVQDAQGVGVLFGNRGQSTVKKEIVILVKPTVIQSDRNWEQNLQETRERLQGYGAAVAGPGSGPSVAK